jgi:hypothetical protein
MEPALDLPTTGRLEYTRGGQANPFTNPLSSLNLISIEGMQQTLYLKAQEDQTLSFQLSGMGSKHTELFFTDAV